MYVDTEVHNSGKRTRTVAVETVLADAGDVPVNGFATGETASRGIEDGAATVCSSQS